MAEWPEATHGASLFRPTGQAGKLVLMGFSGHALPGGAPGAVSGLVRKMNEKSPGIMISSMK